MMQYTRFFFQLASDVIALRAGKEAIALDKGVGR